MESKAAVQIFSLRMRLFGGLSFDSKYNFPAVKNQGSRTFSWLPPHPGALKVVNIDAAVKRDSPHFGVGIVVRDNQLGMIVAAAIRKITGFFSLFIAESRVYSSKGGSSFLCRVESSYLGD
ncbi:hypothetical protein TorRG33x02_062410 [Trema orientale]|uniref:Uncharacterized protein n=1 Tax=Trema orientale TaxID=63057 RepID=A0A2P5FJJ4_TREOI|nr:hypothetical protein TorRG33x02_062410 [Trema orientale]